MHRLWREPAQGELEAGRRGAGEQGQLGDPPDNALERARRPVDGPADQDQGERGRPEHQQAADAEHRQPADRREQDRQQQRADGLGDGLDHDHRADGPAADRVGRDALEQRRVDHVEDQVARRDQHDRGHRGQERRRQAEDERPDRDDDGAGQQRGGQAATQDEERRHDRPVTPPMPMAALR